MITAAHRRLLCTLVLVSLSTGELIPFGLLGLDQQTHKTINDAKNSVDAASGAITKASETIEKTVDQVTKTADTLNNTANIYREDGKKLLEEFSQRGDRYFKEIDKNWKETLAKGGDAAQKLILAMETALAKVDPEFVAEIKNVLRLFSGAPAGTFENSILSTWDHASNMIFFKLFGCISVAAGLGIIYQWFGSMTTGKKPVWVNLLQKTIAEQPPAPKTTETTTVTKKTTPDLTGENQEDREEGLEETEDIEEIEEISPEELDKRAIARRQAYLKNFMSKVVPPIVGSVFALTGLAFILKARSISVFFVNQGSKTKLTRT